MLKETLVYANISLQSVSPRWERWLNPSHLKRPISAGRCGGLVRHITPVRLHWVSVFCSVHEGHRSSCGALAHGHSGKLSTQTYTHARWKISREIDHIIVNIYEQKLNKTKKKPKTYELTRRILLAHIYRHTLFKYGACTLCFGTTQAVPAGLYQPRVPGHGVLKLRSGCACQEHMHTHTRSHTNTHTHSDSRHISAKTKTIYSDRGRKKRLARE